MALEKPVIGTTVPAPAKDAILSYIPNPVSSAPRKINIILVIPDTCSSGNP
ncbi:hypothetical protein D3C76_1842280 [compost metagenome]